MRARATVDIDVYEGNEPDVTLKGGLREVIQSLRRLYPELFMFDVESGPMRAPAEVEHQIVPGHFSCPACGWGKGVK